MNDIDKDRLLYRPDLQPSRDYLSDGTVTHDIPPALPADEPKKDDTPKQIYDDLKEIIKLFPLLPDEVAHLAPSIEKLQKRITIVYPEGYIVHDDPEERMPEQKALPDEINYIGHIPIEDNPALDQLPDLFPAPNNVVLKIEQPKTLVQLIDAAYAKDQVDLDKYYIQKLQTIMQQYFQQMMALMADSGVAALDDLTQDFDGDQVKVPSGQGLEHLRDHIVRSQVRRNQMSRLFKKTHSVDKTLMHMRSWHAANEQRKRYYSEEYKDSSSFTDSHSNSLLRESRAAYDTAYTSALYDMYKYLNSSVMMTNDILNATVKEAQAKAELIKNGVDIFAVDQEEVEFAKKATNSGQVGDGKGSGFDEMAANQDKDKKDDKESDKKDGDTPADKEKSGDEPAKSSEQTVDVPKTDQGSGDFWTDIANSAEKSITSSANKFVRAVLNGDDVGKAAQAAADTVLGDIRNSAKSSGGPLIDGIITQIATSAQKSTPKKVEAPKVKPKTAAKPVDKKNDQSKFPVYNQITEEDDQLVRHSKRVAQLKQELLGIQHEMNELKAQKKGRSKEYRALAKERASLQEEFDKLSSE